MLRTVPTMVESEFKVEAMIYTGACAKLKPSHY